MADGFKVWVRTTDTEPMATNSLVFPTREEAEDWGLDLFSRWTAVKAWEVREHSEKGDNT